MLEKLIIAGAVLFMLWMLAVVIVGRYLVRGLAAHRRERLSKELREPGTARTTDFSKN